MNLFPRCALVALVAVLFTVAGPADARGGHGGHWQGRGHWQGPGPGWYHGGWAAPYRHPGFGWYVPALPLVFATVWIAGQPYYHADGVYYVPAGSQGYRVVPPPVPDAPLSNAPAPVIYPRDGQSPAQTEADRQECNRWATTQQSAMADASVFQRATAACLEGRGYTVK